MNENTDPTHTPSIDLSKYVKRRKGFLGTKEKARERERGSAMDRGMACVKDTAKDSGLITPPNSQISLGMDEAVKSLISPPPEDVLERIHSVSGLRNH
jgi:hypothetical protein